MKQRKKVAILLVVTLILQMMPLPVGSLAGVFGIFSVSQAAETSGPFGEGDNLVNWSVTGTTLTLTGQGTSVMDYCGIKTYYDANGNSYYGPNTGWGSYANVITKVTVKGVKTLGSNAFDSFDKLTSVTMTGVTEIGYSAFSDCSALTKVSLSNVTKVGDSAFSGCTSLSSVTNSGSVESFGDSAFYQCSALKSVTLNKDAKMGQYVFAETGFTAVIWPKENDTISAHAFEGCSSIETIEIPSNVSTLGEEAFNFCSGAKAITGLDNVSEPIGTGAFKSCNSLTDIVWSSQLDTISASAFADCEGLTAITIPDHITAIGQSAFSDCGQKGMDGKEVTVTIPDKVTSIGNNAFFNCNKITGVVIGEKVKSIGNKAFNNCAKLKSLEWKTDVLDSIGTGAFSYTALTEFTIPASVTTIGVNPFIAGSFATIAVESGNERYAVENKMLVTKDAPKMVISYPRYAGSAAVVPDTVKTIGESAFESAGVSTVELPEGLTSMGTYAFARSGLTTVKLPTSLKSTSQYAFAYTQSLKSVELQAGLETIGDCTFYQAIALTSVDFPGTLHTIGMYAFSNATALISINGEGGKLKTVGDYAFASCWKLKDVHFGDDLETLGNYAFQSCTAISGITLPDKLRTLGTGVFQGCSSLKKIVFPNSIESIGPSVLSNCTSLESVDFGSIIQEISGNVFYGCLKLAKVTISDNNPNMTAEDNVLYNKAKTKIIYYAAALPDDKFYVPEGVEIVGSMAFNCCSGLEELRFPKTVTEMQDSAVYNNSTIDKIFFYGNAPKVKTSNRTSSGPVWSDGKWVTTYYYSNWAIKNNRVGSYTNNMGLVIFVLKDSTGWDAGWTGHGNTDTETVHYVWDEQYEFDNDRWDPDRTDVAGGTFEGTALQWRYRDDIGEVKFIGEGASPDFEEDNLFKWIDENAEEWLGSLGKNPDHSQDVKLVDTGDATRIGKNTFRGCGKLYRILSKECLTEIGESAFADCGSLAAVDVSNVHKIEKEAFKNDVAIKDDMDARGVREIGEGAFSGCNGMTEILLGEGLQSLGKETFAACSALETMMLPESTESLGEGCFTGCNSLRTINIPASIQNIPPACFKNCSGLKKVYFYGDCPEIREADAFDGGHADLVIYCRTANTTWDGVNDWNGVPVVHLDKFYTEREDHYSFPNSRSSFGYSEVYYIPLQRYVTAMQSIIRGSFYRAWSGAWGGSCFGMASSSTEFYQGTKFNVKDYTAGAENLYDVAAPRNDITDLTKLIEIYQVSQFEDSISMEIAKNSKEYRKLIKQVEEFERSGGLLTDETADPLIMCIYSGCAGHAVVPVAVNMDNEGNYILDIYDCNYPNAFQKLKIRKDFSGIEYEGYKTASFVRYSTVRNALEDADFTGLHIRKKSEESNTVAIAVNREDVTLVNGGDRDYSEIEDAYEQKPVSDDAEEFSGIRSFILPQGEYKMKDKAGEDNAKNTEEDLKYYVATEDLFSEIKTSDEDAALTVKSYKGTGDYVILSSDRDDTKTDFTVMDVSGIEKEIAVTGSSVEVEVNDDSKMQITVSEGAAVTVDGKPLELSDDNKATVSFYAEAGENPIEADELFCELALDEDNKLSGTAQAYLTWKSERAGNVDIITKLTDEEGNQIAKYTETKKVGLGLQTINTEMQRVTTELGGLSGDLNLKCEMTLADSDGNRVTLAPVNVSLRAAGEEPPAETAKPTEKPTEAPTEKPTEAPTAKPNNPSGGNNYPIVIPTPTVKPASPSPSATVKPTEKPGTVETLKPVETTKPTETPGSIETLKPAETPEPAATETPGPDTESSVPKKGQVKAVGGLKYIVTKSSEKNGTVAVHSAKKKNVSKVVVPKKVKINGYAFKVTGIRKNAFSNMKKLSQVTLGANVKSIGNNAFKNCKKLQFVIIPGKVTAIGKGAFAGCKKLTRMLVKSNKLKSVGTGAFKGVASNVIVKTSGKKWKQYSKMFTGKGKMSRKATFIINPVKLKYGNKSY